MIRKFGLVVAVIAAVDETHRNGLEIHAWVNVYRIQRKSRELRAVPTFVLVRQPVHLYL